MCVLYVSFGSKLRTRTFGCVAMGSAVLVYFEDQIAIIFCRVWSEQRVQVVLSGFSVRLFCFVQANTLCRYGCMYFLTVSCLCV